MDNHTIDEIVAYLATCGPMSGRDICDDLGLEEFEIILAEQDGHISRCLPPHGGSGAWYCC